MQDLPSRRASNFNTACIYRICVMMFVHTKGDKSTLGFNIQAPTRKREDSYLISIIYLLPPIVPLVFFGKKFATARKDMAIADLFNIGEGHPSYTRVKGKPATQDMIGDQLLDKTPPESDTTPAASAKKNQAGKPDSKEPIIEEQPTLASEKETAPPTSASTLQVRSVAPQTNAPPAVAPRKKQSLLVAETMGDDV
ncbi:unnamed protein product [Heligmosomoides polygyrus]|uniref:Histone deacetylase 14 n=1 Tax=Heligmosomoides polygyrus TaxID=6339 RepID=A0A183FK99_HELPZ|nr:unnamed protein product [Heligmosomoides polygyrus]